MNERLSVGKVTALGTAYCYWELGSILVSVLVSKKFQQRAEEISGRKSNESLLGNGSLTRRANDLLVVTLGESYLTFSKI